MSAYVLVPGAGGDGWYFHLLVEQLQARGREAIAVDLPAADEGAGLAEYADWILTAINGVTSADAPPIVVAQSLGGFSAPLAAVQTPVQLLVLLNAMVPVPGESAAQWWTNTGHDQLARGDFDPLRDFFHDVPQDVTAEAWRRGAPVQSEMPFQQPWPLPQWPDVPTRFLQGRDDRLFPLEFQRRVVHDRLALPVDEMPGGHLVALSQPQELAQRLESYRVAPSPDRG
jgi:pimeloyl-ACP methyl ester carboxylesterase